MRELKRELKRDIKRELKKELKREQASKQATVPVEAAYQIWCVTKVLSMGKVHTHI